jgi:hypothetical protein
MMTAQSLEALAVTVSVFLQLFVVLEMKRALSEMQKSSLIARKGFEVTLAGIQFSTCPVLTLKKERDGGYSMQNCGQGPALMAQWGYGQSVTETKAYERLDDNIIPAGATRTINLDMNIARVSGVMLFAYSVTNDKYTTSIKWVDGNMMIVYFAPFAGELPNDPDKFPRSNPPSSMEPLSRK